jgi:hypothetical protein
MDRGLSGAHKAVHLSLTSCGRRILSQPTRSLGAFAVAFFSGCQYFSLNLKAYKIRYIKCQNNVIDGAQQKF